MSSRQTLHGLDLNEGPSPIKKRLGDLTVRESSILADNDYVDIRLETDHENKRKRKKTHCSKPPESLPISSPDYLSSSFDSPTSQKGKLISICKFLKRMQTKNIFTLPPSVAVEDSPQDCVLDEGPCADHWTLQGEFSPENLQVDGGLFSPSSSIVLPADNFKQSNVLPPVKSSCASDEVDCQHSVCENSTSSKVLDLNEVGDLFDQSDLLEELRELNKMQESSSKPNNDIKAEEKLFPNSQLSVKETVILLLGIITRHGLSGVALDDILTLINLICPKENKMPKDAKEVFSFFQAQSQKIVKHFYCPNKNCQVYAGHTKISEQESCGVCKSKLKEEAMFLEIPIQDQLKTVLSVPGVIEKLNYRFSRVKQSETAIEDVYDGHLYRKLTANNGFLNSPHNISLLGNTDGVALVRSTRAGVWPVYYVINELPPKERFSRSNRLFAGIWFGKGKPHFPTFMKPFCQSIRKLYLKGIEIPEVEHTIKGILLDTTMDSPARSAWLNIKQFNGYNGCCTCTEPGEQLDLGPGKKNARRQCHVYPFNKSFAQTTGHAKLRQHDEVKHQALIAMSQISERGKVSKPVEGVLGLSWAFSLPLHDVVSGTAVDYMHCICEGAIDQHLNAWFENKSGNQYLGNSATDVDNALLSIKPISEITRRPRSLSDWKQWKANEKRAFLLYYSLPLLFERLEEQSRLHLAFLVGGVYRLLKDSIAEADLQEADVFLRLYCAQAPQFYGERFQTFNIHQVLHLKHTVQNLGPLWSNSCFPFEDYNGDLTGYFHGSQNIQGQIVKSVCVHQSLPQLAESMPEGSDAKKLYQSLLSKSYTCRTVGEQISEETFVIGSLERVWDTCHSPQSLLTAKEREIVGAASKMWVFGRARINGAEYQSSFYKRTKCRNNFTVVYERRGKCHYGSIEKFVKYQEKCTTVTCLNSRCSCDLPLHYVALLKKMRKHPSQLPMYQGIEVIKHIRRVIVADNPIAVPLMSIKAKCMRIEVDTASVYVCHLPNYFEKD